MLLKDARMVRLDWQREVTAPQSFPCLKTSVEKVVPKGEKIISFTRIPVPDVATSAAIELSSQ